MQAAVPGRRVFIRTLLAAPVSLAALPASTAGRPARRTSIAQYGAMADGRTVDTAAIQRAIDAVAAAGGGTVVVPRGVFVSGALFLKPGVDLHLERGAVLKCSTDLSHFPPRRTRIEGHFAPSFTPALVNADGCDGLRITGEGTFDGAGRPVWDRFWALRRAYHDPGNFPNIGLPRARLALIERSHGVTIEGVTFKDSQFWNLHLYRCRQVAVRNARFEVPDDYEQAPSSDGIDLDSCQQVSVTGCHFSVTDDCIAVKGSKGPYALQDSDSPPVTGIRVRDCTFRRGHSLLTLGSEATVVRDVRVESCRVIGALHSVMVLKLRPDTPQHYEDIHFRDIELDAGRGALVSVEPWRQYVDLKGAPPPRSIVRNVSLAGIRGRYGRFGRIRPNPGQTEIAGILLKDIDVALQEPGLDAAVLDTEVPGPVRYENVVVNGKRVGT